MNLFYKISAYHSTSPGRWQSFFYLTSITLSFLQRHILQEIVVAYAYVLKVVLVILNFGKISTEIPIPKWLEVGKFMVYCCMFQVPPSRLTLKCLILFLWSLNTMSYSVIMVLLFLLVCLRSYNQRFRSNISWLQIYNDIYIDIYDDLRGAGVGCVFLSEFCQWIVFDLFVNQCIGPVLIRPNDLY